MQSMLVVASAAHEHGVRVVLVLASPREALVFDTFMIGEIAEYIQRSDSIFVVTLQPALDIKQHAISLLFVYWRSGGSISLLSLAKRYEFGHELHYKQSQSRIWPNEDEIWQIH